MTVEQPANGSQLNDEQVIELGQMAANAFNNPVFNIIFKTMQAELYGKWMAAPAEYSKEMAALKSDHLALQRLEQRMVGLIDHAERKYRELQEQNSPEAKEKQRLDAQGFGLNYGQGGAS